jgi:crotonobetainyl-CoA:carnitine CoA-transferase CaiB-like acyl-CoA transferase
VEAKSLVVAALHGVRVVESGESLSVGFAGRLLRGLGADVTALAPSTDASRNPQATLLHDYLASGKHLVSGEPSAEVTGVHIWLDGRATAEILADDGRTRELQAAGLVHVAVTPFGLDGPWAGRKASGIVASAMAGFLHLCGDERGAPLKNGGYVVEFQAGLFAVLGALAGLVRADAGLGGCRVDVSLLESVIGFQERADVAWTHQGHDWRRTRRHEVAHPFTIFPCADGFVSLAVGTARHWANLCLLIGRPEWGNDPEFLLNRLVRADEIDTALVPWLAQHPAAEIVRRCQELFIPCGPVLTASQVLADAHMQERRFFRSLALPSGDLRVPGPPFRSEWDWTFDLPAGAAS